MSDHGVVTQEKINFNLLQLEKPADVFAVSEPNGRDIITFSTPVQDADTPPVLQQPVSSFGMGTKALDRYLDDHWPGDALTESWLRPLREARRTGMIAKYSLIIGTLTACNLDPRIAIPSAAIGIGTFARKHYILHREKKRGPVSYDR